MLMFEIGENLASALIATAFFLCMAIIVVTAILADMHRHR